MKKFNNIKLSELELICGGDDYGSILHPRNWWAWLEHSASNPSRRGNLPTCEYYTPAYPGKIVPQC